MRYDLASDAIAPVLAGVRRGDRRSLARCLRWVDDVPELGRQIAFALHEDVGGARIVGVTGNPGAGKSTVVDALIEQVRGEDLRVAVLAVDPSSPFSGGAILGDRIRMGRHFGDDGVFVRSLATRGALGGLSRATFDSVRVLDAAGFDVIFVETVGVGQDEVDIARLAQTTVVVMVPGLGDDVQAIKAGLLEIADVFLVNKADREGAADLERSLRSMLGLVPKSEHWDVPIVRSIASKGEGMAALWSRITSHGEFLQRPAGQQRQQQRARDIFDRLLDAALVQVGRRELGHRLDTAREAVGGGADPYGEILRLLEAPAP